MVDRSNDPLDSFDLRQLDSRDLVAPNFCVYELTKSEIASRLGVDNMFPSNRELRASIHLARHVLQPIRDAHGRFTPNSVFRSQELERALKKKPAGWLSTSQHTQGCACDVEVPGISTLKLAEWAAAHIAVYDQIICECYDPREGPNSGWVHLSTKAPGQGTNRLQLLSYIRDSGSGAMVYVNGLRESVA